MIVTGQYDLPDLNKWFDMTRLHIVHNPDHLDGMFTSVQRGAKEVSTDCFLIPGDMPLVSKATLQIMLQADGDVRVPVYQGRRGHPIYMSKAIIELLKQEPSNPNLKMFRDRHNVNYINVDDPGVLQDIDTIEDYERLNKV